MDVPVITASRLKCYIGNGNSFCNYRSQIALTYEIFSVCIVRFAYREDNCLSVCVE